MPSLIQKLFGKPEAPKEGLTQPQREAIIDLLNYCMYADGFVFLAEDRFIADTVAKFNWDSKVPFDQFVLRSTDNPGNAQEIRASFESVFLTECCPVVWTYRPSLRWHKLSARWQ